MTLRSKRGKEDERGDGKRLREGKVEGREGGGSLGEGRKAIKYQKVRIASMQMQSMSGQQRRRTAYSTAKYNY